MNENKTSIEIYAETAMKSIGLSTCKTDLPRLSETRLIDDYDTVCCVINLLRRTKTAMTRELERRGL